MCTDLTASKCNGLKSPDATHGHRGDIYSWNFKTTESLGTSAGQTSYKHVYINQNTKQIDLNDTCVVGELSILPMLQVFFWTPRVASGSSFLTSHNF